MRPSLKGKQTFIILFHGSVMIPLFQLAHWLTHLLVRFSTYPPIAFHTARANYGACVLFSETAEDMDIGYWIGWAGFPSGLFSTHTHTHTHTHLVMGWSLTNFEYKSIRYGDESWSGSCFVFSAIGVCVLGGHWEVNSNLSCKPILCDENAPPANGTVVFNC